MKPLAIKDWKVRYETKDSRKLHRLKWVSMPNQHDGLAYRRLVGMKDGPALFGAWCVLLQVASKMPMRGVLASESGPLDAGDIAAMTGFPQSLMEEALKVLAGPKIGWIEEYAGEPAENPGEPGGIPEEPALPHGLSRDKRCVSLYAKERVRHGARSTISFGESEEATLRKILKARPDYPMEWAIRLENTKGGNIRDPKSFLANLPSVTKVHELMLEHFTKIADNCSVLGKPLPTSTEFKQVHAVAKEQPWYEEYMAKKFPVGDA